MTAVTIQVDLKQFPPVGSAPAVVALKDLRIGVAENEFVCIVGPSGCGKTTLLNIVAGLDRDFSGRVDMGPGGADGEPVIGYVFQTPRLLPWRTVAENIGLVLRPGHDSAVIDELLNMTGLSEFRNTYPERLSVGMSRRVALARAFAVQPDLLLMDEPFVSLDEPTAQRLRLMLLDIWHRRPATVLFVTHDTREAVMLADRIVELSPAPGAVQSIHSVGIPRDRRSDSSAVETWRNQRL
jgi:NitT/TauT family transport system ATP-binding protein